MKRTLNDIVLSSIVLAIVFYVLVVLYASIARAHAHDAPEGWAYPFECCHQMDCAPVTKAEMITLPSSYASIMGGKAVGLSQALQITTIHGTVLVPHNLPKEKLYQSQDSKMHACIRNGELTCFFQPPGQ